MLEILTNNPLWPMFVAVGAIPALQAWSNKWINRIRQKRTLERINGQKLLQKGLVFTRIEAIGHHKALMGPGVIVDIQLGNAICQTLDGKEIIPMTAKELEDLHVFIDLEHPDTKRILGIK